MLECDKIDVSEGIDIDKTDDFRDCFICNCSCF